MAPILVSACFAATATQVTHDATQVVHREPTIRGDLSLPSVDTIPPDASVELGTGPSDGGVDAEPVLAIEPPDVPVHPLEESFEPKTPDESFSRTVERARIEARGAPRIDAHIDPAALRAAALRANWKWPVDQRRALLAYLRRGAMDPTAEFTDADARIVAQLQAGSGAMADGVIGDETMAVLFTVGFRFPAGPKVMPSEVKLEFYPGELEDLAAWKREIEDKITKKGGGFGDVTAPEGEGTIYVRVARRIVASYRARGGPPSPIEHGDHLAAPTTPGAYALGAGHPHVTSNWHYSQIPWGAEIRKHEDGYQYRWPGRTTWSWATRRPSGTLKEPIASEEFEDLPEVTRGGVTYFVWNKNDFGPIAWKLIPGDQYLHTTPYSETLTEEGAPTILGFSHGCIHVDPRERDEMVARGYLGKDVTLVVRRWDEHLLPNEIRREMTSPAKTFPR